MHKRGVVVGQPFYIGNGAPTTRPLSGEVLRRFLLYWDAIDYPEGPMLEITDQNPDLAYLVNAGVISRPHFHQPITVHLCPEDSLPTQDGRFKSKYPFHSYLSLEAQLASYKANSEREPGSWVMAHHDAAPVANRERSVLSGVEFELFNMLPVPQEDTHLEDILNFKSRRSDELLLLRSHLDDVYLSIANSGDIPRAKVAELDRLERSLNELHQIMVESGITPKMRSLRALVAGEFDTLLGGAGIGMTATIGLSSIEAGAAIAGLSLAVKKLVSPAPIAKHGPFLYLEPIIKGEV